MFQSFETAPGPAHVSQRVILLRAAMTTAKLDAFLVPRADEYQGEYVPPSAERLKWLTGFTGSAGLAIVARKSAALFIDGRYTTQARSETDTSVFDVSLVPRAHISAWLKDNVASGGQVGFDPWLHTVREIKALKQALSPFDISLKAVPRNPLDRIWGRERPAPPAQPLSLQPDDLAGQTAAEKIARIQDILRDAKHSAVVLTLPDSICWLLNIRGHDIAHNPVALAYAIIPASGKPELFMAAEKIGADAKSYIAKLVRRRDPADLRARLKELRGKGKTVRLDANTAAFAIEAALGAKVTAHAPDPCIRLKAIKTDAEIAGSRAAHLRDGVAMVRFLAWLDGHAESGKVDEISAVKQLEAFRAETGALREISFPTIAGSGPNGAIVHYRVSDASNRILKRGELFLVDSGAQYQDGTTDVTRTVAIGVPSAAMRRDFTAVLKGHIAIATARFPTGTRGVDLDPFARRALWQIGHDFDHGTGHGIGSYLSVHEGPQSISRAGMVALEPGMLLSNEPGYYLEGEYGIRLENIVLVTDPSTPRGGTRPMLAFETLTLAPFDRSLIEVEALDEAERKWVDSYHARVEASLSKHLDGPGKAWLKTATAPLSSR